ncbi:MAG TPA: selenocysteine-specific translation elongation factor, partial [Candidatus Eisenbacteria bacterium]|nr:selenocysteine-specific translation elongation factor [Candidatus Eisenbacteria bacterium]
MPTVVIGTAGHIDHGKTTLLRALTGIDADRLPEERARGMTIDVGYAHLVLPDGSALDFVDVPGHDRLVGNMLVGAGEIDAALLVVAADDGPRAQTLEHLELLDALGVRDGLGVITKIDLVDLARVDAVTSMVAGLLERTGLAGAPVVAASAETGDGLDALRAELVALRNRVAARSLTRPAGPLRLAIDRTFAIKGRGSVVTGTLRGGSITAGTTLRLEPGGATVRVRDVQVHSAGVPAAEGGRTALNLAGITLAELQRGQV